MQRRDLIASAAALVSGAALLGSLAGCSTADDLVRADVLRARPDPERAASTIELVSQFSLALITRLGSKANLVCSPLSVLVALAMVRNGAAGTTADEMDRALRLPALDDLNAGMNVIAQALATRSGKRGTGQRTGKVEVELANAIWGQQGYTWEQPLLRTLAADYGTGIHPTDFARSASAARAAINAWVANRTRDKITDIATPDVVNADTRLALVNALYTRAPWAEPFYDVGERPFLTADERISIPMIASAGSARYLSGRGWKGARIPLLGAELAVTVVLPDHDVHTLLETLGTTGLSRLLETEPPDLVDLTVPSFIVKTTIDLRSVLIDLGLKTALSADGEFPGLTTTERLHVQAAKHMGYFALDREGVEAAAATIITAEASSGHAGPDHKLVVDRPFLFVLHDVALALPLVMGLVVDPR